MEERREGKRMRLDLSAAEKGAQRWRETLGQGDFTMLEHFGVSDVELEVWLTAMFEGARYSVHVEAEGRVQMACDRCAQLFWFPLSFEEFLEVHRGESFEMDGDEWEIPQELEELDVMPYVEESLYLELPMRHFHGMEGTKAEECDAEMLSYIKGEGYEVESGLDEESLARLATLRDKVEKEEEK